MNEDKKTFFCALGGATRFFTIKRSLRHAGIFLRNSRNRLGREGRLGGGFY